MSRWTAQDMSDQSGRVVIITGANSGVGYESAVALASKGAQVVMACRNMEKATRAQQTLLASVPNASVEIMPLNLGNLASIHQFANAFAARYDRLDVLMNNAGIMALPFGKTDDGFEQQFGTNHLGHFALTGLLLPLLLKTSQSRVVTVSSSAYWGGRINFDDLQSTKRYSRWGAYAQSKLANVHFARELQRKLTAMGASTISVVIHPGYALTNLQNYEASIGERAAMRLFGALAGQPAERGAESQLYAAVDPSVRGDEFFGPRWSMMGPVVRLGYNRRARNAADGARLWEISEQLTGVCYDELITPAPADRAPVRPVARMETLSPAF